MSCRWIRFVLCLSLLGCCFLGCRSGGDNGRYYMLDLAREGTPRRTESGFILVVPRFTIDTAYSNRGLVYRLGQSQYDSDAYNEFLVPPALMITEKTRDWLNASGLFAQVLGVGSALQPTHRLEANVITLYGDFRERKSPQAVMELKVFLLEVADGVDPKPVFGKTYSATETSQEQDPDGLVTAYNRCLQTILTALEEDVAAAL